MPVLSLQALFDQYYPFLVGHLGGFEFGSWFSIHAFSRKDFYLLEGADGAPYPTFKNV